MPKTHTSSTNDLSNLESMLNDDKEVHPTFVAYESGKSDLNA
jgi:hypothetical protein